MKTKKVCKFQDCGEPAVAKGCCSTHYQQLRRRGELVKVLERTPNGSVQVSFRCDAKLAAGFRARAGQLGIRTERRAHEEAMHEWLLRSAAKV